jgi:hypothetical protein
MNCFTRCVGGKNSNRYTNWFCSKSKEFFDDISKIIKREKTYTEKIELIESHPIITITKCLNELYFSKGFAFRLMCFYVSILNKFVDDFKDDTDFYNLFVIKMFKEITTFAGSDIKKIAEKVVEYIKTENQMEYILNQTALIEDRECLPNYGSGIYRRSFKILKDEIKEALKETWQEKQNF